MRWCQGNRVQNGGTYSVFKMWGFWGVLEKDRARNEVVVEKNAGES